ncbi:hypothetical protein [Clostridium polynesiense]|uniref:hypothetical protein n=1 Tax=Clostridium polynesiense TaxID=1325933 RepID=UPI00058F96EE|nr:hypothetical protein [Clostridium polynesiense]
MEKVIELDINLYKYMVEQLYDEDLKEKVIRSSEVSENKVSLKLDIDLKIELMDYVEDLQIEIGFVNQEYLNEDGKKLQKIYDEIYNQTN